MILRIYATIGFNAVVNLKEWGKIVGRKGEYLERDNRNCGIQVASLAQIADRVGQSE